MVMILLLTTLFFSQSKSSSMADRFKTCLYGDLSKTEYVLKNSAPSKDCPGLAQSVLGGTVSVNTVCTVTDRKGKPCNPVQVTCKATGWDFKLEDISCGPSTATTATATTPTVTVVSTATTASATTPIAAPPVPSTPTGHPTKSGGHCAMYYTYRGNDWNTISVNTGGCICSNPQRVDCIKDAFCAIVEGSTISSKDLLDIESAHPTTNAVSAGKGSLGKTWDWCMEPVMTYTAHIAAPSPIHGGAAAAAPGPGSAIESESTLNYLLNENSPILTIFAMIGVFAIVYKLGLSAQKIIRKQGDSYEEVMEMQTEDI